MIMLSEIERAKSKADKKAETYARKNPTPWYKPFMWVPPTFETVKFMRKGKEVTKVKLKAAGYFEAAHKPGSTIVSPDGRIYEVMKSGALKRKYAVVGK
jgi:hypothetical protein